MRFASAVPFFSQAVSSEAAEQASLENLALAKGLKRQEAGLLDQLIVRYQHRLLRYLLYLTGSQEMAEDLFQEVWMRVLVRGAQYNGKARFETWLFAIARNLVIDQKRKRTLASLEELMEGAGGEEGLLPVEIAGVEPSSFDHAAHLEDRARIAAALIGLEAIYREVLVLRFYEDMSLEEMASVTRTPLSTIKSRLYRGMAMLKPRLARLQLRPAGVV